MNEERCQSRYEYEELFYSCLKPTGHSGPHENGLWSWWEGVDDAHQPAAPPTISPYAEIIKETEHKSAEAFKAQYLSGWKPDHSAPSEGSAQSVLQWWKSYVRKPVRVYSPTTIVYTIVEQEMVQILSDYATSLERERAPAPGEPTLEHSFKSTVQPALNALSLDALREMRGRIEFRIRELEGASLAAPGDERALAKMILAEDAKLDADECRNPDSHYTCYFDAMDRLVEAARAALSKGNGEGTRGKEDGAE